MWTTEVIGDSTATPAEVFPVLADPEHWHEWNDGVAGIRMNGPFTAGTTAVMVFPDATELPFTLAWVEQDRGFEDVTEVPDAGVTVHVRHELEPTTNGTRITYRCTVDGPGSGRRRGRSGRQRGLRRRDRRPRRPRRTPVIVSRFDAVTAVRLVTASKRVP